MNDDERDELIEGYIEEHLADDPAAAQRWRDSFKYWALDDNDELVGFDDVVEWAKFKAARGEEGSQPIKQEYVVGPDGATYFVSTVLIGLDMGMGVSAAPLIFETMIFKMLDPPRWIKLFDKPHLEERSTMDYQDRYSSKAAALAGHDQATAHVRDGKLVEEEGLPPWE